MKAFKCSILLIVFLTYLDAQSQQKNLAEKLGLAKDAKLLILHADDAGVSHSENIATIAGFEKGTINSASIMVPCPWFPEIAAYARQHPELDWGIHTTFTAEWKNYKWDGVTASNEISSLLDNDGYLYASVEDFAKNAKPGQVEIEMRAQIKKAQSFGIKLTHLDNHMGSILASPEFVSVYQKIGKEFKLPVLIPLNMIQAMAPQLLQFIDTGSVAIVNNFISAQPSVAAGKWEQFYNSIIKNLKPGLNEVIFHLAYDDAEMKAITIDHTDFGSEWRLRDLKYVTSNGSKKLLMANNIHLVTWGDIQKVMYPD